MKRTVTERLAHLGIAENAKVTADYEAWLINPLMNSTAEERYQSYALLENSIINQPYPMG